MPVSAAGLSLQFGTSAPSAYLPDPSMILTGAAGAVVAHNNADSLTVSLHTTATYPASRPTAQPSSGRRSTPNCIQNSLTF